MDTLFYLFTFVFGALLGSFLNVVIYRYNTGMTLMGRSFCFSCNKQLTWTELFPIFSFLFLWGKCRFCKSKIAWQYTIVEVLMGSISSLIFWKVGGLQSFIWRVLGGEVDFLWLSFVGILLVIFGLLLAICVYDIKHKIIPDYWVYTFSTFALVRLVFMPETFVYSSTIWYFLAGPLLALPFAMLWYFSEGRWMGFGDAKLALGLGWFLGPEEGIVAIVLAFWIGALFGLALILIGKLSKFSIFRHRLTMKSELPFAPFLILGIFLVFFVPPVMNLVSFYLF